MNGRTRWLLLGGLLIASAILALPLLDVIDGLIIAPLAYLLWAMGIVYSLVPQPVYWVVGVIVLLYVAVSTLYGDLPAITARKINRRSMDGSLVTLATAIKKGKRGVYHKWQTARMLALVALDLASLRLGRPVKKLEWEQIPPCNAEIKAYLDAGLNKTFADFPTQAWLGSAPATELDIDLNQVLNYLDKLMEIAHE